ncbi:hypothetical protein PMZ80_005552 [Knufia obscura]|uniref:F-box domain-containing protein n=1 Tax=Knufia obscura TaxID=1635080 RepID=A0ABR0RNE4_9EURO|nr:hypothetical protein PMZ80_005552 [Knufia obscura]
MTDNTNPNIATPTTHINSLPPEILRLIIAHMNLLGVIDFDSINGPRSLIPDCSTNNTTYLSDLVQPSGSTSNITTIQKSILFFTSNIDHSVFHAMQVCRY